MNFHLAQVLNGHDNFNENQHHLRINSEPLCSHCVHTWNDGLQYTLFECEAWLHEWDNLVRSLDEIGIYEQLEAGTLVPIILRSSETLNCIEPGVCFCLWGDETWDGSGMEKTKSEVLMVWGLWNPSSNTHKYNVRNTLNWMRVGEGIHNAFRGGRDFQ